MNFVASADLCSRWRFRCRELKKKAKKKRKEKEKRARQAERKLSSGSRLTSQYSINERATLRPQKKENGKWQEREREREGKKEMQERVVKELLTVDSIPLFRRAD